MEMNITDNKTSGDSGTTNFKVDLVHVIIAGIGLIGNGFVLTVLLSYSKNRSTPYNMLVMNQTMADFIALAALLFNELFPVNTRMNAGSSWDQFVCRVWHVNSVQWAALTASNYNVVAITLERYLAIGHPILHKTKLTGSSIWIAIVIAWVVGVTISASVNVSFANILGGQCFFLMSYKNFFLKDVVGFSIFCAQYLFPLIALVVLYICIYMSLRKRVGAKVIPNIGNREFTNTTSVKQTSQDQNSQDILNDIKANKTKKIIDTKGITVTPVFSQGEGMAHLEASCSNSVQPDVVSNEKSKFSANNERVQVKPVVDKVCWNVIKTAALVSLCFFLCQSWNELYMQLFTYGVHNDLSSPFFQFTMAALFSNCAINPLIYGTRYRQFRLGFRRLLSSIRQRCSS